MAPVRQSAPRLGARRGQRRPQKVPVPLILGGFVVVLVLGILLAAWSFASSGGQPMRKKQRPIPSLGNTENAVAIDIIKSLECETWFDPKTTTDKIEVLDVGEPLTASAVRRRLQAMGDPEEEIDQVGADWMDDQVDQGDYGDYQSHKVTGRELFCLVAGSTKFQQDFDQQDKDELKCDAQGTRREALLDIWASARTQMPFDMLTKVLDLAVEKNVELVDRSLNIWIPAKEENLDFYREELNKENSSVRNIAELESPRGLFVDIGSGLGLSTLSVSLLYPKATVFSIEPAMPSWLLQRISLVCNLEPDAKLPHPILSGVGAKADGMLKISWSPSAAEKSRAWTPLAERTADDIELTVRLRTLRSIMAEAAADADVNLDTSKIVLNIDCEGCEYNVIPAMKEKEFKTIDAIIGTTGVHWGYIPKDKLPSSNRGKKTHERLCSHYDFARQSIECCDFPQLVVKHEGSPTVSNLLGGLCHNFTKWADEKSLYTSTDDYGWTELSNVVGV